MKKYVYILLMTLGLIGMYSCENVLSDEDLAWNKEEDCYANLTISMNVPPLNVESRTLASDPKNQGGSWTNWEKFVDGALLYRVTLFVIDKNDNKLVAYRNFYSGSSDIKAETEAEGENGFYETSAVNPSAHTGVAVKATFKSQNPMHGSIEKLKPGTYKLIAVANYAPIDATNDANLFSADETPTAYAGLGSVAEDDGNNNGLGGSFTSIIDNIIGTSFNGVDGFNQTNYPDFFNYKLNSGTDRVCKQLPQPLVMIREVTLQTGENQVEGLLSRTFARVRLEVKNNDKSSQIGVSGLFFQDNYASQNAYLFNDVAAGNANLYDHFALYESTKGEIGVTSADAITPALEVMKRLPAGSPYTMLDCYILEGMISATYAFQFTAYYWEGSLTGGATANYHIESFYGYKEVNGTTVSTNSDYYYGLLDFMVYIRDAATSGQGGNGGSNYLLTSNTENEYSQNGTVTATTPGTVNDGTVLDPKYVWEIKLTSDATYSSTTTIGGVSCGIKRAVAEGTLQNLGSGLYLQPYDGSDDMIPKLADTPGALIYKINFDSTVENGTIFCLYKGSYYYLDSDNSHNLKWVKYTGTLSNGVTTSDPNSYQYLAFETIPGQKGDRKEVPIQKAIGATTEGTITTNEIVRNDFYYGIVPISISSSTANQ